MSSYFGAKEDIGEWSVGSELNLMEKEGAEGSDKGSGVVVEGIVLRNPVDEVPVEVLVLGHPSLLTTVVDDGVLVWVVIGGGGAGRGDE